MGSGLSPHSQRGPHRLITGMGHHGRLSESPFSKVFAPQWPAETPRWWNTPGPSGRRRTGMRSIRCCGTSAPRALSSATCPPSAASPAGTGRSLGSPAQTVSTAPPPCLDTVLDPATRSSCPLRGGGGPEHQLSALSGVSLPHAHSLCPRGGIALKGKSRWPAFLFNTSSKALSPSWCQEKIKTRKRAKPQVAFLSPWFLRGRGRGGTHGERLGCPSSPLSRRSRFLVSLPPQPPHTSADDRSGAHAPHGGAAPAQPTEGSLQDAPRMLSPGASPG